MTAQYILVVDDEPDIRQLVSEILEDEGYEVATAENAEEAKELRRKRKPDLVLLDIWMPGQDGISLLKDWQNSSTLSCPVIMMSGHGTIETAVEATRLGAHDFIEKPLSIAKMLLCIENALRSDQLVQENKELRDQISAPQYPVGSSPLMVKLREQADRISKHNSLVLIYGEGGVGKEVFARYIHSQSENSGRLFLKSTVSLIPKENMSVEIFGSEIDEKISYGLLDQAQGGTLYLSDIGGLTKDAQKRLLIALRQGYYTRVGGDSHIPLSVKLIFSSQHDLRDDVEAESFDKELYLEISVVPLMIPELREHPEDVPELLNYYVDQQIEHDGLPYRHFSVPAQNFLRNYKWLGNIRELSNLVQRLLILGTDSEITQEEVEEAIGTEIPVFSQELSQSSDSLFELPLRQAREQFEHDYLDHQLKLVEGNVSKLAELVQMERTHLYRKMRSLKIDPKKYGK
ncbi:nitrogen assimilation response regulator NtrX [Cocleimonas flava]|uniref:DNA-binding NtrC family response regulator n=1 Tax=Cocleimonas flava TaxID=634765 RepID=A0A4R1EPR2_9GAMM|nr:MULTISPECIES: sigma-54 dependent transcriptional regulator [Cocleimonas]MEB8432559.1 sigma-54 dependent transcriptional regulator [Cocleimonas sp. KMM 6892]MEC4715418.1 sigma-54 dependent transcriptional regulator [Cocleimonas sp. KMM 6895]MEC4744963.1 sigma-54 dependent transcriptional regulator [Cocleimonas sp. KMM 6896]TCJ82993.1 DNA-binding NtrC family response regulator [Cocleimonas flava]